MPFLTALDVTGRIASAPLWIGGVVMTGRRTSAAASSRRISPS